MILPIVAYGDPVLRKVCDTIPEDYPALDKLIEDMFQTMYHSNGVGLAAPQVGQAIRLFVEFLLFSLAYSVFSSLRIKTETKVSENDNILSILCN